jgi:asparagine synthase (glutamine-hydrolysing)
MSMQHGVWNFDGQPADSRFLERCARVGAQYSRDGEQSWTGKSIAMCFQPFHITKELSNESQPLQGPPAFSLTWDGRLDNRAELLGLLHLGTARHLSDASIVLAAYERYDTACFDKLLGDWALALWDPIKEALLLAKDFVGVRQLFYALEPDRITWSTVMDPLLLVLGRSFKLSEEYVAGYLTTYPATHLTPYLGINAVSAGTFALIQRGRVSIFRHSSFGASHRIRYRTDSDYEHHFLDVFGEAVRRRLRSSFPVLAELSGGMDSASIVCMADSLMAEGRAETPRLDTISYYDNDEPNWDERPYFTLIENKRGRSGYHIDIAALDSPFQPAEDARFSPLPGEDQLSRNRAREFSRCLKRSACRVLLSGIGGDEFLGGVPTPIPELQDLLVRIEWVRFLRQLASWSFSKRMPWTHLCFEAVEEFLPQTIRKLYKRPAVASWLSPAFVRRNPGAFSTDTERTRLLGPLPSFQAAIATLNHVRRQLGCAHLREVSNYRITYPFLDRDLLKFLFAIPREQLCRPGMRRSLMRRALAGLVPAETLARKRKAFVARRPLIRIQSKLPMIEALLRSPLTVSYQWLDPRTLAELPAAIEHGQLSNAISLVKLMKLDLWLQQASTFSPFPDVNDTADALSERAAIPGT